MSGASEERCGTRGGAASASRGFSRPGSNDLIALRKLLIGRFSRCTKDVEGLLGEASGAHFRIGLIVGFAARRRGTIDLLSL